MSWETVHARAGEDGGQLLDAPGESGTQARHFSIMILCRERVDGRLKKAAAEARTGDSMASDGGLYALVGLEGPVEMWPQMPTLLSTLSGDRPGETSHANQTPPTRPPTTQGLMQDNKESIWKPVVQAPGYWSDTERVSFISMLSVLGTNWPMISEMLETKTTVMVSRLLSRKRWTLRTLIFVKTSIL